MNPKSCRYHPHREAGGVCSKYEYGYCEECLETCAAKCSDPKLYCRHRSSCIIWEHCRRESAHGAPRETKTAPGRSHGVLETTGT